MGEGVRISHPTLFPLPPPVLYSKAMKINKHAQPHPATPAFLVTLALPHLPKLSGKKTKRKRIYTNIETLIYLTMLFAGTSVETIFFLTLLVGFFLAILSCFSDEPFREASWDAILPLSLFRLTGLSGSSS